MHLSTAHLIFRVVFASIVMVVLALPVQAAPLKPFKDELFSYGTVLETGDSGDYRVVDYDKMRDIHGRDQEPERRVRRAYVSLSVKRAQANETLDLANRPLNVMRVGAPSAAAFTVIFIHGRNGDRRLGANDYTFGGNFNRLKNLARRKWRRLLFADMKTFDDATASRISPIDPLCQQQSPGRPVILDLRLDGKLQICWGLTRNPQAVAALKGMMIMGGPTDPAFTKSAAYKKKLPIFFSHGSDDSVYAAADQIAFYRSLKKANYPSRFVLFQTGSHGTPVRMTDWRDALNWIGLD
jgi:hypothetical protein